MWGNLSAIGIYRKPGIGGRAKLSDQSNREAEANRLTVAVLLGVKGPPPISGFNLLARM